MTTLSKKKVILGLSGGVDSTAAALLLKEKGMDVTGFYFDVHGTDRAGEENARVLARRLGIGFISMDVSSEFEKLVIVPFCEAYLRGETPNPCIICNLKVKFKKLIEIADERGAYYIATGHYARIFLDEKNGLYFIRKSVSIKRDQSYMLYRLGQKFLSRLICPLGELEGKEDAREIARRYGMPNSEVPGSQEICFIDKKEGGYISYMESRGYRQNKGNFVDKDGNVLGEHGGMARYTIGQRKGLGVALGKPAFVVRLEPEKNQVVLGDNSDLFTREVYSRDNFFAADKIHEKLKEGPLCVEAKIRYAAEPVRAKISLVEEGNILTKFEEPVRAVTPGQSVVFYSDDHVIGGGIIYNGQR